MWPVKTMFDFPHFRCLCLLKVLGDFAKKMDRQKISSGSYHTKLSYIYKTSHLFMEHKQIVHGQSKIFLFLRKGYTLSKSSNWSSLLMGHPLYLILQKCIKDITLTLCICNS